ncbi:hypothetical protein D3C74_51830 [compost metagenome]
MATLNPIHTSEQLHAVLDASSDKPVLVFKHSTRCPISARAHQEVENYLRSANDNFEYGIILVVEDRPVSLEAADVLQVKHESPQVILVKDGSVVWHTSHSDITAGTLQETLSQV